MHGPGSAAPESVELLCATAGVALGQYSFEPVPVDPVIPHVLYGQAMWGATAAVAQLSAAPSNANDAVAASATSTAAPAAPSVSAESPTASAVGSAKKFCPHCGAPVEAAAKFCGKCGEKIGG